MDQHPRLARIENLKAKLRARDGKPGYEKNCDEIREQIANLEKAHLEEQANDARLAAMREIVKEAEDQIIFGNSDGTV